MLSVARLVTWWRIVRDWVQGAAVHERTREATGALLARNVATVRRPTSLADVEFRIHSQFGDDGIVQWLIAQIPGLPKRFIEFGVEDYTEANTRFLMVNNGWAGLVMDGARENIRRLRKRNWYWRHDLTAIECFVTCENVDRIIDDWACGRDVGLLHIDVDGNDYWLWKSIRSIKPAIVIMEYNAVFGAERAITVPYRADFERFSAHRSGQYFGASLAALAHLAQEKGYFLLGVNSAGNNAYFLRLDLVSDDLKPVEVNDVFVTPRFRESRDNRGRLDYSDAASRQAKIRKMPVFNVFTESIERF